MLFVHIHWFTETPRLRHSDVSYALSMVLNMLSPPPAQVVQTHHNSTNQKPGHHHHLSMSENHRCSSFSHHIDKRHDNELVLHVAFLGRIFYFLVINRGRSRHFHKGGPFRISKQLVIRKLKRYWGVIQNMIKRKLIRTKLKIFCLNTFYQSITFILVDRFFRIVNTMIFGPESRLKLN